MTTKIISFIIRLILLVMTKRGRIAAIKKEPSTIRYIFHPTVDEEKTALDGRPLFIRYIKNPSKEAQSFAINQDVKAIKYIKNPTDEMSLLAKLIN